MSIQVNNPLTPNTNTATSLDETEKTERVAPQQAVTTNSKSKQNDSVSISSKSEFLAKMHAKVDSLPEVDAKRVAEFKAKVAAGELDIQATGARKQQALERLTDNMLKFETEIYGK